MFACTVSACTAVDCRNHLRAADGGAGRTVDFQRHIHRDELKRASDKNQARRAIPPLLGSEKTGPLYGAALPQQPHTART